MAAKRKTGGTAPPPKKRTAKKAAKKTAKKRAKAKPVLTKDTPRASLETIKKRVRALNNSEKAKKAAKKTTKKKAAKKTAKKTTRKRKPPKAKAVKQTNNFLAEVKKDNPGITADEMAIQYSIPPEEIFRMRHFVHEYLKDFNPTNAALRMGYDLDTAPSTAKLLLYHAFTQLRLHELMNDLEADAIVSGNMIVARLWQEANAPDVAFSSNASTRIAALKELAKIKRLHQPTTETSTVVTGVMYVPLAIGSDSWADHAKRSQKALKDSVIEVETVS